MLRYFSNLSVRFRLLALFGLVTLVMMVIGCSGWIGLDNSNASLKTVLADRVLPLRELKAVSDLYAVNIVDTTHKVRSGALSWDEGLASLGDATRKIKQHWGEYIATKLAADEARLVQETEPLMGMADTTVSQLIELIKRHDGEGLIRFAEQDLYPAIDPVTEHIGLLVDLQINVAQSELESAQVAYERSALVIGLAGLSGLAVIVTCVMLVVYGISGPLRKLEATMSELASKRLDVEVPYCDRRDELGSMAKAVAVFKDNANERERLEAEQAKEQEARDRRAQRVDSLIQDFNTEVSRVLNEVTSAATQMNASSQSMSATAEETSRQATVVAAASEQASVNVQTVASAAEQLASSVHEIGRQVAQSSQIADRAVGEADKTNAQVQMLAESAEKIGDVVKLISDIAAQTNLLALNATIEAARAGEAGKGFAVVASEVKSLATQTARATQDIAGQIKSIQSATGESVTAIDGIGKTIRGMNEIAATIAAAVEEQQAATQEIARNVQQASVGTAEVSSNIGGVSSAAAEAGSASTQVLNASQDLARHSETLRGEVGKFLASVRAA